MFPCDYEEWLEYDGFEFCISATEGYGIRILINDEPVVIPLVYEDDQGENMLTLTITEAGRRVIIDFVKIGFNEEYHVRFPSDIEI